VSQQAAGKLASLRKFAEKVQRYGPFKGDAAEFRGSSRPCCSVDNAVISAIVSCEIVSHVP
jgi:hypothetical protein